MATKTKIAQISDLHIDDFLAQENCIDVRINLARIFDDIKERGITRVVLSGDFGVPEAQGWLLEAIRERDFKPLFILGNHDSLDDFREGAIESDWIKADGLYYTRRIGEVECIFLDSSVGTIGDTQLEWLVKQLEETARPLVVFIHHPILDCGNTAMDQLYPLINRDELGSLFADSGRDISIFCGHYHTTHEQHKGTVSQFVTPSALLQIKQRSNKIELDSLHFGYREIELSPQNIKTKALCF